MVAPSKRRRRSGSDSVPVAVDLFCGAGGLTQGLRDAGFVVAAGVDSDPLAAAAYGLNHPETKPWRRDIRRLAPEDLLGELGIAPGELHLLAGCPPCQGFSTLRTHRGRTSVADPRNGLVAQFARFAEVIQPRTILMENVPGLESDRRLKLMSNRLRRLGYRLSVSVLDACDFGIPQRRRRLVLLGSLEAEVEFADELPERVTVRDAIGRLDSAGESGDELHDHGEQRSLMVRERIASIPADGGSRSALGADEQLACHRRSDGWFDVYGRMAWDEPAPTITSGCINPSKGRFLHPEENRAITLREAALLQGFPPEYRFPLDRGKYKAAALIGNALPPGFVAAHARTLRNLAAA